MVLTQSSAANREGKHGSIKCGRGLAFVDVGSFPASFRTRHFHIRAVASNGIVGPEQRAALRVLNQRVVLYPLVFVLCWGPGEPTSLPPPTPFQALTSASQGFLNCLVYGWTTVLLRQVGLTALSRDANTQTPLLQPQPTRNYKSLRALC
uniref:Uncharacterized protein n=1 Tax=Oryzias sinensis TaxID=183150 RepID=A0A8C7WUX1_9TELE